MKSAYLRMNVPIIYNILNWFLGLPQDILQIILLKSNGYNYHLFKVHIYYNSLEYKTIQKKA